MIKDYFHAIKQRLSDNRISTKGVILWILAAAVVVGSAFGLHRMSVSEDGRIFPVYINEILAANASYPNSDGRCCDYIELYNSADYPVDLTGFQLGDIAGSGRYAFPYGTVIEAGGYLTVWCDSSVSENSYAKFGISRSGGETFYLIASNGAVVDRVTTISSEIDEPMIPLGNGEWTIGSAATPGLANTESFIGTDIYNSSLSPVRISEFSSCETGYSPSAGIVCDWIELHNTISKPVDISGFTLSDNPGNDKYHFPAGTVIPGNGYLTVYCSKTTSDSSIAPFGLNTLGGEQLVLKNGSGMIIELIDTPAMDSGSYMLNSSGTWVLTAQPSPGHENSPEGHKSFLQSIGANPGTIVISEVMTDSIALFPDEDGEFSDWVELYNTGGSTVDLAGWYLSDDPTEPRKWLFPSCVIEPGEYLIVFCSGKETSSENEFHAGFSLSAGGESVLLTSPLGTSVCSVSFGASQVNYSFLFPDYTSEGVLSDSPTPGFSNDSTGYEAFCASRIPVDGLSIWEVMTSNDWYLPQQLGECYDWVELKNTSGNPINLSDYTLTDDPDSPELYRLPNSVLNPGESYIIILSGDESLSNANYAHAGFSLNTAADQLLLYGKNGLQDWVWLSQIPLGCSYGRSEDGAGFFYMDPSPYGANHTGYRQVSSEPVSETQAGVYVCDSPVSIPLSASGTIYYTTDGSDPDSQSDLYTGPINIADTTVLRAVSIEEGKFPSEIYTATFLFQKTSGLPVVSLVTDPGNLWGVDGIYKNGDMNIKEERRSANISYTGDDGSFCLDCEISLHGATTVIAFNKKSFTLRFHDNYDGPLNYDLYEDSEVTSFRSLILRTAHESTVSTHMRDALMGQFAQVNMDHLIGQKYKYVTLYINGEYWGLYALREHHSQEHYASYMDVPASSVSIVRYCTDAENSLYALYQFCEKNSLVSDENYQYAASVLDMESMAEWIILQSYVGNIDINGNMRYYYDSVNEKWCCGLVDLDLGMFSGMSFDQTASTFHHGTLVGRLLQNETFQDLIATRLAELLSGPLSDGNMLALINAMADQIRGEIPYEGSRWGYGIESWENQVDDMRTFVDGRAAAIIDNFCATVSFTQAEKETYFGQIIH